MLALKKHLSFKILPQPDETTCGPTCLHAVYRYYGETFELDQIIRDVPFLDEGGTLAVFLACDALRRGYSATIYTYNVQVFDPTWFSNPQTDISDKLSQQAARKNDLQLRHATEGYLEFLRLGGVLKLEDLTARLIRQYLRRGIPILTGLNATILHHSIRESGPRYDDDDIGGNPVGHFVVLLDYVHTLRSVMVADPLYPNPMSPTHVYPVGIDRVVNAILLGIITHDANLLILEPPRQRGKGR